MDEKRILRLASTNNKTRKECISNGTTPNTEITVEAGVCIATRHLGRNGSLISNISSTLQVAEIPHVTVGVEMKAKNIEYEEPKQPPMITKLKRKLSSTGDINLINLEIPLSNGVKTPKLMDVLEKEVDESYFLNKRIIETMVSQSEFKEKMISLKTSKKKCK